MLLRFSVGNHLSLREPQELLLVASSLTDEGPALIDCPAAPGGRVLPAVVIYGANASGKSNVIAGLTMARTAILLSHRLGEPGGGVSRMPFALHPAYAKMPSTFDADFVIDGVRYHYGFMATDEEYISEWLYAFPYGRRQLLFERKKGDFLFGRGLKGRNKVISDLTRPNSLFLSAATQNDHEELSKVSGFFGSLRSDSSIAIQGGAASRMLSLTDVDRRIISFLEKLGTGVVNFRWREQELPIPSFVSRQELASNLKGPGPGLEPDLSVFKQRLIELAHLGHEGQEVFLELKRESSGTRRLLIILSLIFRALDSGTPLVIDELDASLHTQACEAVISLFNSPSLNPMGAQLITTTHDTNLLHCNLLRRDQIWFTEKDNEGATHLYPLTDIRTRKGDNIEKGYLQGRFGAIPFAGRPIDSLSE
jgi:hypothetical protein